MDFHAFSLWFSHDLFYKDCANSGFGRRLSYVCYTGSQFDATIGQIYYCGFALDA